MMFIYGSFNEARSGLYYTAQCLFQDLNTAQPPPVKNTFTSISHIIMRKHIALFGCEI